jgi:hypothetical protein
MCRRGGPYAAAVALTAEPEAERLGPGPQPAHPPWIWTLAYYERRETSEIHGARYG